MKLATITTALTALLLPTPILSASLDPRASGGRCSGAYNTDFCICLDHNACVNTYGGTTIQGGDGAYPCPNDADNVWGCFVSNNCPTLGSDTSCRWSNSCANPLPSKPAIPHGLCFKSLCE